MGNTCLNLRSLSNLNRAGSNFVRFRTIRAHAASSEASEPVDRLAQFCNWFTNQFPVWMIFIAVTAYFVPEMYLWLKSQYFPITLSFTMLGMGLTMTPNDFTAVFRTMPQLLLLGLVLQYTVMPALGLLVTKALALPTAIALGIIIVSCCPGGTASNIVAYIARGEMGLSVMMTTASTMAAIFATPLLTATLAGTIVPVDAKALFISTVQVVLAPVTLGVLLNSIAPKTTKRLSRYSPFVATVLVLLIVGSTLGHSADHVRTAGPIVFAAVLMLHSLGFLVGYVVSRGLGLSEKICRTNSIEVGMQNSTLGAVLASCHFADPLVTMPCAVSACAQTVLGSMIAGYWRSRAPDASPAPAK